MPALELRLALETGLALPEAVGASRRSPARIEDMELEWERELDGFVDEENNQAQKYGASTPDHCRASQGESWDSHGAREECTQDDPVRQFDIERAHMGQDCRMAPIVLLPAYRWSGDRQHNLEQTNSCVRSQAVD